MWPFVPVSRRILTGFQLYMADDNYHIVIARFNRSRRVYPKRPQLQDVDPSASAASLSPTLVENQPTWTTATLELVPRAVEIQDTVVTSFLFLEKAHRVNEHEHMNRADVLGTPVVSMKGNYRLRNGGV